MKEWTTPDSRNTPSTTNLEEEEFVEALGNDGNASMPEQVKRPNPRRRMMMIKKILTKYLRDFNYQFPWKTVFVIPLEIRKTCNVIFFLTVARVQRLLNIKPRVTQCHDVNCLVQ